MPSARMLPSRAFAALLLAFCFAVTLGVSGAQAADVSAVAANGTHTCALQGGAVKCWGTNSSGELGDSATAGSYDAYTTPFTVPGVTGASAVAAGQYHTCVIDGGAVKCWGTNTSGEVGDPATTGGGPETTPFTVSGITDPAAIAAGYEETCVIDGGAVKCWGAVDIPDLGGPAPDPDGDPATPQTIAGITNATSIAVGAGHACAVDGGAVTCWGDNESGQLGDASNVGSLGEAPYTIPGITNATAVTAGAQHTCALLDDGTVRCWGSNAFGQLGDPGTVGSSTATPFTVPGIDNATALAGGYAFTCAQDGGAVKCWGDNEFGQIGDENNLVSQHPALFTVPGLTDPTAIAAGNGHVCALDGGPKCWGLNLDGQAGNRATVGGNQLTPFTVDLTAPDAPTVTNPVDSTAINDNTPTFEADAEPGSKVTFTLDGTTELGSATADSDGHAAFTPTTPLDDGDHSVKATATDAAGNVSAPSAARTMFTVDTKAPDTPTFSLADGTVTNDPSTVVAITAEPNATMHILFDGAYLGSVPTGPDGAPRMGLREGEHTVSITVIDDAGNASEPATIHYTLDTTVPDAPTLTAPAGSSVLSDNTPTFKADAEPGATVTFTVDGTTVGTATAGADGHAALTPEDALTDGRHTVKATATDRAGNVSDASDGHTFTVDTTAPAAVTFGQAPARKSAQPTAKFAFTGEPGARLECSLDGADWSACTSPLTLTGLADGPHSLRVRALDAAGNVSAPAGYAWTVDTTPTTTPNPPSTPNPPGSPEPPADTKPKTSKVTVPLAKKTTVADGRVVTVGCRLNAGALSRCRVSLYAHGKRIGRATRRVHGTHRTTVVHVKVSARGRRLLTRARHGLAVTVKAVARSRDGRTLRDSAQGRLYRPTVFTVPAHFHAKLDRSAARLLRGIARDIAGAKTVTCAGYTDSRGSAAHNRRVGLQRARIVCAALDRFGVRADMRSVSHGEQHPVAGNHTAKGRRANQRVVVRVSY